MIEAAAYLGIPAVTAAATLLPVYLGVDKEGGPVSVVKPDRPLRPDQRLISPDGSHSLEFAPVLLPADLPPSFASAESGADPVPGLWTRPAAADSSGAWVLRRKGESAPLPVVRGAELPITVSADTLTLGNVSVLAFSDPNAFTELGLTDEGVLELRGTRAQNGSAQETREDIVFLRFDGGAFWDRLPPGPGGLVEKLLFTRSQVTVQK